MWRDETHLQRVFPLGNINRSRSLMNAIRNTVEEILDHRHQHCPNCGGLTPEIVFTYKGYEYYFTCTEIRRKKRVIAGTDYKKLRSFCNSKIQKPK
jgi:hypothetical protein